jgi:hypothetical protein
MNTQAIKNHSSPLQTHPSSLISSMSQLRKGLRDWISQAVRLGIAGLDFLSCAIVLGMRDWMIVNISDFFNYIID